MGPNGRHMLQLPMAADITDHAPGGWGSISCHAQRQPEPSFHCFPSADLAHDGLNPPQAHSRRLPCLPPSHPMRGHPTCKRCPPLLLCRPAQVHSAHPSCTLHQIPPACQCLAAEQCSGFQLAATPQGLTTRPSPVIPPVHAPAQSLPCHTSSKGCCKRRPTLVALQQARQACGALRHPCHHPLQCHPLQAGPQQVGWASRAPHHTGPWPRPAGWRCGSAGWSAGEAVCRRCRRCKAVHRARSEGHGVPAWT
jgi:hypothetical protein